LADAVSGAILDGADRLKASEGEIKVIARRIGTSFGGITLNVWTPAAQRAPRFTDEQIRRLAADARTKVLAHAAALGDSVKLITLRVYSRGPGFDIGLNIDI
jgi:hypothetical protein